MRNRMPSFTTIKNEIGAHAHGDADDSSAADALVTAPAVDGVTVNESRYVGDGALSSAQAD